MTTSTPSATNEEIAAAAHAAEQAGTSVPLPPIKVAFVIDGELVDILHTDERLGAIFLSEPTIVDLTDTYDAKNPIPMGSSYDATTNTFTPPVLQQPTA